jgi:hypothetical protein
MRVLAALHRWWGVAFCLLFAIWFASGMVMHFVPFPARIETGRPGGLAPAGNGRAGSERDALRIAAAFAREHQLDPSHAHAGPIDYDQWTVAGEFDSDRPLYRIALEDGAGTELYVSSATGDVVLLTTRNVRLANYFGSVAHWIYPTVLRHNRQLWSTLMWWLSLVATIGAGIGVTVGLARLWTGAPYVGLQRWHHILGLIMAPFTLCWIFSGFLSMVDEGPFGNGAAPVDLFLALHALDFPPLVSHPRFRSGLIVGLCLCGFAFSLTGAALAWRRLRMGFARQRGIPKTIPKEGPRF